MGPQILRAYDRMTARSDRKEKKFYPIAHKIRRGRIKTLRIFSKAGSLGQISTAGKCLDTAGIHESWLCVYNSVLIPNAYIIVLDAPTHFLQYRWYEKHFES